ncbi:hypothetical protein LIER_24145 [Lithospermum erythrorhizon]|uniref:Uncharacterized protein n=1 Tax=Lithospermum erythrorhizon TaxID=34254 RepID=A0AAV3R4A3_LITER
MSLLIWNCRGVGHPRAVRSLARLVTFNKPNLVFLIQTKLKDKEWDHIKKKINMPNDLAVDREDVKVDWPYFGQGVWRNLMRLLHGSSYLSTIFIGDFNEILSDDEYVSQRRLRPQWQMDSFLHVVKDCVMIDIGYSGFAFTWYNNFISPSSTRARLD